MAAYKIKAKVVSLQEGLKEFDDIRMVRIKSKRHTLLIMEDFMPVIGELDGSVEFVYRDKTEIVRDVKGYYMHKKNEFSCIIRDGVVAFEENLRDN
ncbi:MAG: hypothetical protein MJ126_07020 [Lachnospiraceae bacterium]|nr:hypothetical protein [Lachnospiraceae bacterium]